MKTNKEALQYLSEQECLSRQIKLVFIILYSVIADIDVHIMTSNPLKLFELQYQLFNFELDNVFASKMFITTDKYFISSSMDRFIISDYAVADVKVNI